MECKKDKMQGGVKPAEFNSQPHSRAQLHSSTADTSPPSFMIPAGNPSLR